MGSMNTAYLLIGGNLGDRAHYLQTACHQIEQLCGNIVHYSAIYETAAWGNIEQPGFYNQALMISTEQTAENLMKTLLSIEEGLGRIRTIKMGPRTIDLDILLFNNLIVNTDLLTLPHPALPMRRFALLPLAEIAPGLLHPVLNKTISDLLADCDDRLDVQKKIMTT